MSPHEIVFFLFYFYLFIFFFKYNLYGFIFERVSVPVCVSECV